MPMIIVFFAVLESLSQNITVWQSIGGHRTPLVSAHVVPDSKLLVLARGPWALVRADW